MEFVEFVRHAGGEGWASLGTVMGKVEGRCRDRMGDLKMLGTRSDGGTRFGQQAVSIADLQWLHRVGCG